MKRDYKCPYLVNPNYGRAISCELSYIKPPDREVKSEVLEKFCGGGDSYKSCPWYSILDNYYKRKYADWEGER